MTVAILRLDEVAHGRALAGMTDDQKARGEGLAAQYACALTMQDCLSRAPQVEPIPRPVSSFRVAVEDGWMDGWRSVCTVCEWVAGYGVDTTSSRRIHCVQFAQLDLSRVFGDAHCQKEEGGPPPRVPGRKRPAHLGTVCGCSSGT